MLVVEDDELSQNLMSMIFRKEYEISFCESAEEYYGKCGDKKFDIIIMDVSLNGTLSGIELISEIKKNPLNECTPIICLTAHTQAKVRLDAIESGADLFYTKPVKNALLKQAVSSLLNK